MAFTEEPDSYAAVMDYQISPAREGLLRDRRSVAVTNMHIYPTVSEYWKAEVERCDKQLGKLVSARRLR